MSARAQRPWVYREREDAVIKSEQNTLTTYLPFTIGQAENGEGKKFKCNQVLA